MAKGFKGTVKAKLQTPVEWEGNSVSIIELDFSKLTPKAIIEAERNCGANFTSVMKMTNVEYCSNLASYMMAWDPKIAYRILMKLDVEDFDVIWQTVGSFVGKGNPQEFYDRFTADDDDVGFTRPAELPETKMIEEAE